MRTCLTILATSVFVSFSTPSLAQSTDSLSIQGLITDLVGDPIDSANVGVTFKLYKGSNEVWSETRPIDINSGIFNTHLGKVTPLDSVLFDQPMELGVKLAGEGAEFSPRIRLAAAAFALGVRGFRAARVTGDFSSDSYNVIAGAYNNAVAADVLGATISGGGGAYLGGSPQPNLVEDDFGTISGGADNITDEPFGTIGGGRGNHTSGLHATVAGGYLNYAAAEAATVAGGQRDSALATGSFVGGGERNTALGLNSSIAGGESNRATGHRSAVGGGMNNLALAHSATISGGSANETTGTGATVGGGSVNEAMGESSTIAGGASNTTTAIYATVGGGNNNMAAVQAVVAGGTFNTASAAHATVSGGFTNVASGTFSVAPGGLWNLAQGSNSFAGGRRAQALHDNSFVWNDGSNPDDSLQTEGINQFRVKANGGAWFFSGADTTTGVYLATGAGTWTNLSSQAVKTDVNSVDAVEILRKLGELQIGSWRYRDEPAGIAHIGPFAEDFYAAFGLGSTNRGITTVDATGVALAAIQGLYHMVLDLQQENRRLWERLDKREAR